MIPGFRCAECDRLTESFEATVEGPHGTLDTIIPYCHFCHVGFYRLPNSKIEMVEIETPVNVTPELRSSGIANLAGRANGII